MCSQEKKIAMSAGERRCYACMRYLKICPPGRGVWLWHHPCLSFPCSHGLCPLPGPGTPLEKDCHGGLGVQTPWPRCGSRWVSESWGDLGKEHCPEDEQGGSALLQTLKMQNRALFQHWSLINLVIMCCQLLMIHAVGAVLCLPAWEMLLVACGARWLTLVISGVFLL